MAEHTDWEGRLHKIEEAKAKLQTEGIIKPTHRQIANVLGVSVDWIKNTRNATGTGLRRGPDFEQRSYKARPTRRGSRLGKST